jgi:hypothetical protein
MRPDMGGCGRAGARSLTGTDDGHPGHDVYQPARARQNLRPEQFEHVHVVVEAVIQPDAFDPLVALVPASCSSHRRRQGESRSHGWDHLTLLTE